MLKPVNVTWGTDPEGFLQKQGCIIGSEKVIPEAGLGYNLDPCVVLDGVQFELHPAAGGSVMEVGEGLRSAFSILREHLRTTPDVSCCFNGVVEVSREELDSLSDRSRILGCAPSKNIYGLRGKEVDGVTYRKRSAGGHIHLGLTKTRIFDEVNLEDERSRQVPLLDIFVGNTGVLLDRDPGAAERRRVYGMAGEYRLPKHGLEYRTLSNFWLRNYSLMSLMFGMAHVAVAVLEQSLAGDDAEAEVFEAVNVKRVIRAIQTNNFELARKNFESLRPFLMKHLPEERGTFPLIPADIDKLLTVADVVNEKGLEAVFPEDHVSHWNDGKFVEFGEFVEGVL